MKKASRLLALLCAVTFPASLAGCAAPAGPAGGSTPVSSSVTDSVSEPAADPASDTEPVDDATTEPDDAAQPIEEFADIRYIDLFGNYDTQTWPAGDYSSDFLRTLTFNEGTVVPGCEQEMARILEEGKDPGLGVRGLHEQGVTGEGVNVAIIDQNLFLDHPEYAGKIAAYYDTGCQQEYGSMHGPAVTSILAGETVGVAPGARVYYAAMPTWLEDSQYAADAADWIIQQNRQLPEGEKIRVVSVSAAFSGEGSVFQNGAAWEAAVAALQAEGILVLDARQDPETCRIAPCCYDPADRQDPAKCSGGYSANSFYVGDIYVGAPASCRTLAEEYVEGVCSYQYDGSGGHSWAIPYGAGVLALGWQVDPTLGNEEILQLLFDSCATGADGSMIIDPPAFIEAVREQRT